MSRCFMSREIAPRRWTSVLVLLSVAMTSCNAREAAYYQQTVYQTVRLVEHLDEAVVTSPLREVTAVHYSSEFGEDVHAEQVWRASPEDLQIPRSCSFKTHPDLEQPALRCSSGQVRSHPVAVEPQTFYRVRFQSFRTRGGCFHSSVTEHSSTEALRIHETSVPSLGEWTESEGQFLTTPETRSLTIALRLCSQWLNDLTVERLNLTAGQELALLKGQNLSPGADPAFGVWKRGRMLPLADPSTVEPPFDSNYILRDAFFAPAPTDLKFEMRVPPGARLRFSYALAGESRTGDQSDFRLIVQDEKGREVEAWSTSLIVGSAGEGWHWHDEQLDLGAFQNQQVHLTFRTRSSMPRAYALWGNPVMDVPSKTLAEAPNVVLIAVDTLRADRLSSYGHSAPTSPNIDALAADGVRFDQAAAPFTHTMPSFTSLLTGYGAIDSPEGIPSGRATLASRFRLAGWATAAVAYKAYLYTGGFDQGFDHFFNVPRTFVRAENNVARAVDWLDKNQDRRFFLFMHLNDPHQPFCQPPETLPNLLRDRLGGLGLTLPLTIMSHRVSGRRVETPQSKSVRLCRECVDDGAAQKDFQAISRELYDHAVTYTDEYIGRFLQELKNRGLYDDTVIAFVSDHGEGLWRTDDRYGHGGADLYDDLTRVPLIVKPPKDSAWARNKVVRSQVRHYDLMPTLLELAGIDPGGPAIDGESLVPSLKPADGEGIQERVAIMLQRNRQMAAVRYKRWKYIARFEDPISEQLFHLEEDPGELHDVLEDHPEVAWALRLELLESLLVARSGQVLLVTGDPPTGDYEIHVTWDQPDVSILPIAFPGRQKSIEQVEGASRFMFKGQSGKRLLLLARFMAPSGSKVRVKILAEGSSPRWLVENLALKDSAIYKRGVLPRLLELSGEKVSLFRGTGALETLPAEPMVDARQLEALRALGYID